VSVAPDKTTPLKSRNRGGGLGEQLSDAAVMAGATRGFIAGRRGHTESPLQYFVFSPYNGSHTDFITVTADVHLKAAGPDLWS